MRITKVIGKVTLSRCHPAFEGATLKLSVPLFTDEINQDVEPSSEPLVLYDQLGAGNGDQIMLSEGPEAAQPFRPEIKPVDAYNAGIIDELTLSTHRS